MPDLTRTPPRIPDTGRYWLKRVRIDTARLDAPLGGALLGGALAGEADGTVLADLRIEEGRIRAVLPAGEAPCCAPGPEIRGGRVSPQDPQGRIGPGHPADLIITDADGSLIELRAGVPVCNM